MTYFQRFVNRLHHLRRRSNRAKRGGLSIHARPRAEATDGPADHRKIRFFTERTPDRKIRFLFKRVVDDPDESPREPRRRPHRKRSASSFWQA